MGCWWHICHTMTINVVCHTITITVVWCHTIAIKLVWRHVITIKLVWCHTITIKVNGVVGGGPEGHGYTCPENNLEAREAQLPKIWRCAPQVDNVPNKFSLFSLLCPPPVFIPSYATDQGGMISYHHFQRGDVILITPSSRWYDVIPSLSKVSVRLFFRVSLFSCNIETILY